MSRRNPMTQLDSLDASLAHTFDNWINSKMGEETAIAALNKCGKNGAAILRSYQEGLVSWQDIWSCLSAVHAEEHAERMAPYFKKNPTARNNMAFRKKYGLPQAPAGDPVLMQLPRVVLLSMGEAGAAEIARRQLGKSLQKGLEVPLERQSLKMRPRLPEGFTRSNPRNRQKYIVTAYSIDGLEFCTAHGLSEDFGAALKFDTLHQAEVHAERQRNLSRDGHSYDGDGYSSHVTYRVMPLSKFKR